MVSAPSATYNANSDRLTMTTAFGTATATYDAQDRLLTYGSDLYSYTPNGELASRTVGIKTRDFIYDDFGNLLAVKFPNGNVIEYIIDPEGRRVGKLLNGTLVAGFLYQGSQIIAQLNSAGKVISRFIYAMRANSPDYMVISGISYRIFTDQLGSPRLVVNATTGAIAEEIDYDEFGNVINDTNPGFQPFGFAAGLYDSDTKLVRFGAREYDPRIGRWITKDPILFAGGDTNLYNYSFDDPINLLDTSGTISWPEIRNLAKATAVALALYYQTNPGGIKTIVDAVVELANAPNKRKELREKAEACGTNKNKPGGAPDAGVEGNPGEETSQDLLRSLTGLPKDQNPISKLSAAVFAGAAGAGVGAMPLALPLP
jgi:RHS repeat-associated protein